MRPATIQPATTRQAGFTLLELLVGLVVLGFILAGLSQGARFGLRAAQTQSKLIEARGELDAVDRALRRLLAQAAPGTAQDGAPWHGTAARLAFVSALPAAATLLPVHEADLVLAVEADQRLMLRWAPHRHAIPLAPAPASSLQGVELLRGVQALELGYWSGTWRSTWDAGTLPGLVRLRIVFPPGDGRHWPDIVVAPERHPAQ